MTQNTNHGIQTSALAGLKSIPVRVEADVASGLPYLSIVGLADTAVHEARDRVRSAIRNSQFPFPQTRVTVNLSPAHTRKVGTGFDLAIALAILQAQAVIPSALPQTLCVGELDLRGNVLPVAGVLPLLLSAPNSIQEVLVSIANAAEAALQHRIRVIPVPSLRAAVEHIVGQEQLPVFVAKNLSTLALPPLAAVDFADIRGQIHAKRALEIAAAGGHNVLFTGPPGAGKTLLAQALGGILPPLEQEELLEVVSLHSIAGILDSPQGIQGNQRSFRAPHHSSSLVALIGGGRDARPGDISLAHHGVLFLDELPEFPHSVLESLRQPLEEGVVYVSRAENHVTYPARFTLVAARNPCPCGYAGSARCRCTIVVRQKYRRRISGPLLDRIDLHVAVQPVPVAELHSSVRPAETSAKIRQRVTAARQRQTTRFNTPRTNASLTAKHVTQLCRISPAAETLLLEAVGRFHLSARTFIRLQKISRTIADLAGSEQVGVDAAAEALLFRDRQE